MHQHLELIDVRGSAIIGDAEGTRPYRADAGFPELETERRELLIDGSRHVIHLPLFSFFRGFVRRDGSDASDIRVHLDDSEIFTLENLRTEVLAPVQITSDLPYERGWNAPLWILIMGGHGIDNDNWAASSSSNVEPFFPRSRSEFSLPSRHLFLMRSGTLREIIRRTRGGSLPRFPVIGAPIVALPEAVIRAVRQDMQDRDSVLQDRDRDLHAATANIPTPVPLTSNSRRRGARAMQNERALGEWRYPPPPQ
jgi:hypothetical protein